MMQSATQSVKSTILIIGGKTAESRTSHLYSSKKKGRGAVVYGRDIVTGLPVEREIPTELIVDCLKEHFNAIIDNIKVILEERRLNLLRISTDREYI